jgi:hypothetical protein
LAGVEVEVPDALVELVVVDPSPTDELVVVLLGSDVVVDGDVDVVVVVGDWVVVVVVGAGRVGVGLSNIFSTVVPPPA